MLGLAGSGKSTQSKLLAEKSGYKWLAMGDILRQNIHGELRQEMLEGKILDQQEVINILEPYLMLSDDSEREIVLDGFPRGVQQAEWLVGLHQAKRVQLEAVVHILADEDIVKSRLMERGRQDDNENAIKERFYEYEHAVRPIVKLFEKNKINIIKVNGDQTVEAVHNKIVENLITEGTTAV